jgi:hypothetical protein
MSASYDSQTNMVLIRDGWGRTLFRFSGNRFTELEIDLIRARHICNGCAQLPTNGFKSYKNRWCDFSRKIAMMEETALGR